LGSPNAAPGRYRPCLVQQTAQVKMGGRTPQKPQNAPIALLATATGACGMNCPVQQRGETEPQQPQPV
jgi:hypothetical protein